MVGQVVKTGDKIVTIEAMKMKTEVRAKGAGKVIAIAVKAGRFRRHRRRFAHARLGAVSMTMPDTLYGALMLSFIDFFAAMVMISGIGVVLALFPLLNRIGKIDEEALRKSHH